MRAGSWVRGGAAVALMATTVAALSAGASPAEPVAANPAHEAICHPASSGDVGTLPVGTVTATIPRVVAVQLDREGHPVRLWTNTGTCPRGDEQLVVDRSGHRVRPSLALRREIARHVYRGDWSQAGVWHRW